MARTKDAALPGVLGPPYANWPLLSGRPTGSSGGGSRHDPDPIAEGIAAAISVMTSPAGELAASCHHAPNAAPQLASKAALRWLTSTTVAGLRPSGDERRDHRTMHRRARVVEGFTFTITDPPLYQRLVDRLVNAVFVPLSWLTVLDGDPPVARRGSLYKVQVTNPAGQRRTIALATSDDDAESLRDRAVARAEELGVEGWAREQPIPPSFFEHHRS